MEAFASTDDLELNRDNYFIPIEIKCLVCNSDSVYIDVDTYNCFCEKCKILKKSGKYSKIHKDMIVANCCEGKRLLDISPRHQEVSHIPLELLEKLKYIPIYDWMHYYLPLDFGPIKNWFFFTFDKNGEGLYMINIKDLRVAKYQCRDNIVYKYNSYDEYKKAHAQ